MRIILIGNYPGDRQESMKKYSLALRQNLINNGVEVDLINPIPFFSPRSRCTNRGIFKWLGYLDKYIVFPIILKRKVLKEIKKNREDVYFHICDHSNSIYLNFLPRNASGITCHDVLAIQGAFGYDESFCPATKTGKLLQNWIFKNLKEATVLTTVSQYTMDQLLQLSGTDLKSKCRWKVIYNSFNSNFSPMGKGECKRLLDAISFPPGPFILHVGSGLARKNRKLIVKMVEILGESWNGNICFAGDPLNKDILEYVEQSSLRNRIISLVKPDHLTLLALYSSCEAFVFPSFSEGFGWPVIEAQACGTPVLASSIGALKEIGGNAAIYANPYKPEEFAEGFLNLIHKKKRSEFISLGFENCKRFDSQILTKDFIQLYQ